MLIVNSQPLDKSFTFSGGEVQIRLPKLNLENYNSIFVTTQLKSAYDVIELELVNNALALDYPHNPRFLEILYLPYARQDRQCWAGEAFSAKWMVDKLNDMDFSEILVLDVHSDLNLPKKFTELKLLDAFKSNMNIMDNVTAVVAPDKGSVEKVSTIAEYFEVDLVVANKVRDPDTGYISSVEIIEGAEYVNDLARLMVIDEWDDSFFNKPKEVVCGRFKRRISLAMDTDFDVSRLESLHDLGYLPVHVKALPEGSFVPYGCPPYTIVNTLPEVGFFWVTNMLESVMQCELWQPICSATTYREYNRVFKEYAIKTGSDLNFVPFQAHDFSFRGMPGRQAAAKSAFAVIAAGSKGTDTLPGIDIAHDYYGVPEDEFVAGSVFATEHSVMASGILLLQRQLRNDPQYADWLDVELRAEAEYLFILELITVKYPRGNISIVSDTYDFWNVITNVLPRLKDVIMTRNGKLIIRPDSGDPVDILCGYAQHEVEESGGMLYYIDRDSHMFVQDRKRIPINEAQYKGMVESLWDTFGGTVTDKGYKVLDSHIGAIYGDSITLGRQSQILKLLEEKKFASQNVVLGVGSYSFQYVTRDTHSLAMKATSVVVNGEQIDVYKDPKTDDGTKKSARGRISVSFENGKYVPHYPVTSLEEMHGALQTVFKDGKMYNKTTLAKILAITQAD